MRNCSCDQEVGSESAVIPHMVTVQSSAIYTREPDSDGRLHDMVLIWFVYKWGVILMSGASFQFIALTG